MSSLPVQSPASPVVTPQEGSPSTPATGQSGSFGDVAAPSTQIHTSTQHLQDTPNTQHLSEIDSVESDGVGPETVASMKQDQQNKVEDLQKKIGALLAKNPGLTPSPKGTSWVEMDNQSPQQRQLNRLTQALQFAQNWLAKYD